MNSPWEITITIDELKAFHSIDRYLYARLINMRFDNESSKILLAFWNWLESRGFKCVVENMTSVTDFTLFQLASDSIFALGYTFDGPITHPFFRNDYSPFLGDFLDVRPIQFLKFTRVNMVSSHKFISNFVVDVCDRAFSDITASTYEETRTTTRSRGRAEYTIEESFVQLESSSSFNDGGSNVNVNDDGDRHEDEELDSVETNQRDLFVTFPKRHPVHQDELEHFFISKYGNCIQSMFMPPDTVPPFMHVIFKSSRVRDEILQGRKTRDFSIHGNDVRVARFIYINNEHSTTI